VEADFPGSVAALREELKRLEAELQRADAAGDRQSALEALARMLSLQKQFMKRWPPGRRPASPDEAEELQAGSDLADKTE
jgi:hypothetical protein